MIDTSMYHLIDWSKPQSWKDAAQIIDSIGRSLDNSGQDENIAYDLEDVAINMRRHARHMEE
jgi:hypothetical protein